MLNRWLRNDVNKYEGHPRSVKVSPLPGKPKDTCIALYSLVELKSTITNGEHDLKENCYTDTYGTLINKH